jgi:hypothetical protein
MRNRNAQATPVLEVPSATLMTQSKHAVPHPSFAIPVAQLTGSRWLTDAVETCRKAKLRPLKTTELSIFKLVRTKDGDWECIVAKTVEKPVAFETSGETKFTGKVDVTDASAIDGYFSGSGHGANLRTADAARIISTWANAVAPSNDTARTVGIALTIRAALLRGVVLESYQAVV